MMQTFIKKIKSMALAVLLVCVTASCVYDKGEEPAAAADEPLLVLNIELPVMQSTRAVADGYEEGTGYENYINTTAEGLRIYLFGADNKFIQRFIPMMVIQSEKDAGGNVQRQVYTVVGKGPEGKEESSHNFKVVVLANWPYTSDTWKEKYSYFDTNLTAGTSTIADLCSPGASALADAAQCDILAGPKDPEDESVLTCLDLNPAKGRLIPFYGVHEYKDVTFEKGKRTELTEPVTLLRAMAKIEVVFDNPGLELSDVILHGYNSRGYCAPDGVNEEGGYDKGNWDNDYVKTLHLVGGNNDSGSKDKTISLFCKNRANPETNQKETWVGYVPEYRNTVNGDGTGGPADDKAWLELKLNVEGITLEKVFFCKYEQDQTTQLNRPVENSDFDLHRNNLYRFNVSLGKGGLIVYPEKWGDVYINNYTFE